MSKKFKKIIIISLILLTILVITVTILNNNQINKSVGSSSKTITANDTTIGSGNSDLNMVAPSIVSGDITQEESYDKQDSTKVIKNSNISMNTDEYDNSLNSVNLLIKSTDSMVVKMQESKGNNYYSSYTDDSKLRRAEIIVKVAKDKFDTFNNEIKKYANVTSYNEESKDISSNYSDVEAKIESYKLQEKQLNGLLNKATVAKDLLEISNQIQKVIQEREYLQRQKNSYDNQIEYSTVSISLAEVKSTVIKEKNIFVRMGDTFKMSLIQIKDISLSILMTIVYFVPYVILLVIILFVIYIIIKANKNKK